MVTRVSEADGDGHQVSNAYDDRVSISTHVYGGNIGRITRAVFDPATAPATPFVSAYANASIPNAWCARAAMEAASKLLMDGGFFEWPRLTRSWVSRLRSTSRVPYMHRTRTYYTNPPRE